MKIPGVFLLAFLLHLTLGAQEIIDYHTLIEAEMKARSGKINPPQQKFTTDYDVLYHRFEWEIDPAVRYIRGAVMTRFKSLSENFSQIYFDMSGSLAVDSIIFHNEKMNFEKLPDDLLRIDLSTAVANLATDSIIIFYQGTPPTSGFGSFEQKFHGPDTVPVIWTLSQPYGARDWRPCKQDLEDKADSIDVFITTPAIYKAAGNGILTETRVENQQATYHWKHRYPIPAYLVSFAVTNYVEYTDYLILDNGDSIPILNYVYPEILSDAQTQTKRTLDFMNLFNDLAGTYPFADEKYGHAQCNFSGGMEHTTMSFMGSFSPLLQAHELAHQWFGDKITCGSWEDIWLNEGFATYFEGLTYQFGLRFGPWDGWLRNQVNDVISQPDGSVWVDDTTSFSRIFSGRLSYTKGAMVLHMLRWKMGDADFFQAIRNYLNDPALAFGFAKTQDLRRHFEQQSGLDLSDFFNKWIYQQGYPAYEIEWWKSGNTEITLRIDQTTSHPSIQFFDLPVPLQLSGQNGDSIFVADHLFSGQTFSFDPGFETDSVIFDPEIWLVAKAEVRRMDLTSVQEKTGEQLKIYPNPAGDLLFVETGDLKFSTIKRFEIFDLSGKKLADLQPVDLQKNAVPVRFLKSGNYQLKILFDSNISITKPFIKL